MCTQNQKGSLHDDNDNDARNTSVSLRRGGRTRCLTINFQCISQFFQGTVRKGYDRQLSPGRPRMRQAHMRSKADFNWPSLLPTTDPGVATPCALELCIGSSWVAAASRTRPRCSSCSALHLLHHPMGHGPHCWKLERGRAIPMDTLGSAFLYDLSRSHIRLTGTRVQQGRSEYAANLRIGQSCLSAYLPHQARVSPTRGWSENEMYAQQVTNDSSIASMHWPWL